MTDDDLNSDNLGRAPQENSEHARQTTAEWNAFDRRNRVGRLLNRGEWIDVLVLGTETARAVLAPTHLDIIHALREHETPIDTDTLVQDLDREPATLVDNLTRLVELDVVSPDHEDGPHVTLTHQHVVA